MKRFSFSLGIGSRVQLGSNTAQTVNALLTDEGGFMLTDEGTIMQNDESEIE